MLGDLLFGRQRGNTLIVDLSSMVVTNFEGQVKSILEIGWNVD